jgi:hypothetical protein
MHATAVTYWQCCYICLNNSATMSLQLCCILTASHTAVLLQEDDDNVSIGSATSSRSSIAVRIVSEGESRLLSIIAVVPDPHATSPASITTAQDQLTTVANSSRYGTISTTTSLVYL